MPPPQCCNGSPSSFASVSTTGYGGQLGRFGLARIRAHQWRPPGPHWTSAPLMLLPGTFGSSCGACRTHAVREFLVDPIIELRLTGLYPPVVPPNTEHRPVS